MLCEMQALERDIGLRGRIGERLTCHLRKRPVRSDEHPGSQTQEFTPTGTSVAVPDPKDPVHVGIALAM